WRHDADFRRGLPTRLRRLEWVHPAARWGTWNRRPGRSRRPPDVQAGLSELLRSPELGGESLGDYADGPGGRAMVRIARTEKLHGPGRLPTGHVRAGGRQLPLDGLGRHGQSGQHRARVQRLRLVDLPVDELHGTRAA